MLGHESRASNPKNLKKSTPSCTHCLDYRKVVKAGTRKTKTGSVQLYKCQKCKKRFSERTAKFSSYPSKIIFNSIATYNIGHDLGDTVKIINRRYKIHLPKTTLHSWLTRYKDICTFTYLRKRYKINPEDIIPKKKFYHQQVYEFKYHKLKLNIVGKRYPTLRAYLLSLEKGIDNRLFKEGLHCSDFPLELNLKGQSMKKIQSNNATKIARFGLELARTSRERHQAIEDFFLINDSATIATEIPVFLTPKEARTFGILISKTLTGHIDILQVRSNRIHILDYKPDAQSDKLAQEQLTLYALALGKRTKIPPKKMTCAYFDQDVYFQFTPIIG